MAELQAVLTANIKELEKKLDRAEKQLLDYGKTADRANTKAERSFRKAGRGAANASPALQDIGRVIQDLPFGIRGVGNNIDQLFASFNNLSRSSGGVKNALGAIVSGLVGPAGIAIAVSSVIALFTTLESKGLTLGDAINSLFGKLDQAAKAQRDFNKAIKEGVGQAQSEINSLGLLLEIARDVTSDKETRANAIKRINEEYKDYLPNINQENINTKNVVKAVEDYNKALIRQAKIKGAQNLISEEFAKILELESKSAKDAASTLDKVISVFAGAGGLEEGILSERGAITQQKEIGKVEERINSLRESLKKLLTDDLTLTTPTNTPSTTTNTSSLKPIEDFKGDLNSVFAVQPNAFANPIQVAIDNASNVIDQAPKKNKTKAIKN